MISPNKQTNKQTKKKRNVSPKCWICSQNMINYFDGRNDYKEIQQYEQMFLFLDITINNVLQLYDIHIPTTFLLPDWTQTVTWILHLLIFWLILSYYRKIRGSKNSDFYSFKISYLSVSWCNLGHRVLRWIDQNNFLFLVTFCVWHQIKLNYKIWTM